MKKIFSLVLVLALLLGTLAGCAIFPADDNNSKQDATLTDALAALDALYKSENGKDGKNGYELVGSVTVGDTAFNVIWTTDNQSVTITKGDNGNYFVKLPTKNDEAAIYSLVATVTDTNGEREVYSFTQNLPVLTAGGNNKPTPPAQDNNDSENNGGNDNTGGNNAGNNDNNNTENNNTGNTGGTNTSGGKELDGTYTYKFTDVVFESNGTQNLGGVNWTLDGNGGYWGFDGTRGHQFGSKNNPYEYLTLTSEAINGIKEIRVEIAGASGFAGNIFVYVGGVQVDQPSDVDNTAKTFIFDSNTALNGEIEIEILASTARAIYIKSITIVTE